MQCETFDCNTSTALPEEYIPPPSASLPCALQPVIKLPVMNASEPSEDTNRVPSFDTVVWRALSASTLENNWIPPPDPALDPEATQVETWHRSTTSRVKLRVARRRGR